MKFLSSKAGKTPPLNLSRVQEEGLELKERDEAAGGGGRGGGSGDKGELHLLYLLDAPWTIAKIDEILQTHFPNYVIVCYIFQNLINLHV